MDKSTVINASDEYSDVLSGKTVINRQNSSDAAKSEITGTGRYNSKETKIRAESGIATAVNTMSSTGFDMTGVTVLDRYEVRQRLDITSGEADLYLCADQVTGCEYILKLYRRKNAVKDDMLSELRKIKSRYIGSLIDYGRFNDYTFVIITYFKNGSLQGRRFSADELRSFIIPSVNSGLKVLHDAGIIHKDIKPSNLMLSDDGKFISIIDFGISSIVDEGQTMLVTRTGMSPVYSAPETFNNLFLCESDYYSFGITLYELYTGHTPYVNLGIDDMAAFASLQNIPFDDDFPEDLKLLIQGLTYKDLSNRKDLSNPNRRWTENEVSRWLKGEKLQVPGAAEGSGFDSFTTTFSIKGKNLRTAGEIADALGTNWKIGKVSVGRGLLFNFFKVNCAEEYANYAKDCEEGGVSDFEYFKLINSLSDNKSVFYWNDRAYEDMKDLASAILQDEINGGTVFANDDFLWSLNYFYRNNPELKNLLDKIYQKSRNTDHVSFKMCMLDIAYLLGSVFMVDNHIFESPEAVDGYFSAIKKKGDNDFLIALLRCFCSIREYSVIYKGKDNVFSRLLDTNVLDLILDYSVVTSGEFSSKHLRKFGIAVVDSGIGKFSELLRFVDDEDRHIKVLYFKISPPEKFFISDEDPEGPEEIDADLIILAPHVRSVARMFAGCARLKKAPNFNTSQVDDMFCMFKDCRKLVKVPKYKTGAATNMNQMFRGCTSLAEVPAFDTGSVTDTGMMFCNCSSLMTVPHFNFSSVSCMKLMFSGCRNLTSVPDFATRNVTDMSFMFSGCTSLVHVPVLDMSEVKNTEGMFMKCTSVKNYPVGDLPQVRNMNAMFKGCSSLSLLPEFNTPHLEDLSETFFECGELEEAPAVDTSSVIYMSNMFNGCSSLRKVPRYRTDRVTDMQGMFSGCSVLAEIPSMQTERVSEMGGMFMNCSSMMYAPDMNTSSVTDMNRMFFGCSSLMKIPAYNTANVQNMDHMFDGCKSLRRIPRLNTKNVLDCNGMYDNSALPDNIFRYESTYYIMLGTVAFILIAASVVLLFIALG